MADDCVPHWIRVDLPDDATLEDALTAISGHGFHHQYAGGLTTWLVSDGRHGRKLAAIPKHYAAFVADPRERIRDLVGEDGTPTLFFHYKQGIDPDLLQSELLPPDVEPIGKVLASYAE